MSKDRRDLKVMSISMMALGIAVPAFQVIFGFMGRSTSSSLYITLSCIVSAISLVTGYLGTRCANSPRKGLQHFRIATIVSVVAGVAFTGFFVLAFGATNPDYFVGALVACFGAVGLYYAYKLGKRLERQAEKARKGGKRPKGGHRGKASR